VRVFHDVVSAVQVIQCFNDPSRLDGLGRRLLGVENVIGALLSCGVWQLLPKTTRKGGFSRSRAALVILSRSEGSAQERKKRNKVVW
jgi:hypothetical protein